MEEEISSELSEKSIRMLKKYLINGLKKSLKGNQ
ncbi:hypothetical protein LCGC14_0931140 [marine sediment metagenome]|uniref:Uncharacterized protein n=1 Tax=marine sediment metagenome TaxID=412755 RepID=A0A0F9NN16_9ZZZZ